MKSPWMKLWIALAVIGLLMLIVRQSGADFSGITVKTFKEKIHSFGIWGPVAYMAFYVVRPLLFLPAAVCSAVAGAIWGLEGLIYLLIAANISAIVEFVVARYFAREAVERLVGQKMAFIDRAIERRGFVTVLLIRLIPNLPWDIQNLGLGLTKVKARDYVVATAIGILPGSFVLVYFGSSLISVYTDPENIGKLILAAALFAVIYGMQKFLRKKKSAMSAPEGSESP